MSEQIPQASPDPNSSPAAPSAQPASQSIEGSPDSGTIVAITAILALALVTSCCILSCALVTFAFFNNPPW